MSIGFWQVVLILLVIFLLFGAKRLPTMMSDLAKGIKAFKTGLGEEEEVPVRSPQKKKALPKKTPPKKSTPSKKAKK